MVDSSTVAADGEDVLNEALVFAELSVIVPKKMVASFTFVLFPEQGRLAKLGTTLGSGYAGIEGK